MSRAWNDFEFTGSADVGLDYLKDVFGVTKVPYSVPPWLDVFRNLPYNFRHAFSYQGIGPLPQISKNK